MLCGLLLVLGIRLRGTALLIMAMLAVFTPMIFLRGLAIHEQQHTPLCGIYFDCGCGAGVVNFCVKLAENTALFLGALDSPVPLAAILSALPVCPVTACHRGNHGENGQRAG